MHSIPQLFRRVVITALFRFSSNPLYLPLFALSRPSPNSSVIFTTCGKSSVFVSRYISFLTKLKHRTRYFLLIPRTLSPNSLINFRGSFSENSPNFYDSFSRYRERHYFHKFINFHENIFISLILLMINFS